MTSEFAGKRVLVTGTSRGAGSAIALDLAERGADIALTYSNSVEAAANLARKIEILGRRAFPIYADRANAADIKHAVGEANAKLGGLDILVNNAGVAFASSLETMTLEHIDQIIAVNVRSMVLASQAAIPYLKKGGRIISIGSRPTERLAFESVALYSLSESALLSFTKGLARELEPRKITVNLVYSGPINTSEGSEHGMGANTINTHIALGSFGTDRDMAEAVAFIASRAASNITGTGLSIDGDCNN